MYYLEDKQRIWLNDILYGENKRIRDWYFELPIGGAEAHNTLNDIILDGYYTKESKDLLNYIRREYIKEFGIGSTIVPMEDMS